MYLDETKTDRIEVFEDGQIQVRDVIRVYKDGVLIAQQYSRRVLEPGCDVKESDPRVAAIAGVVWTDEVKTVYAEKQSVMLENMRV